MEILDDVSVFVISLEDAYYCLFKYVPSVEDKDVTNCLFSQLVAILLDTNINYSEAFSFICKEMEKFNYDREKTQEICDTVFSLIIDQIIQFMPKFISDEYRNKYQYTLINKFDIKINIKNVPAY